MKTLAKILAGTAVLALLISVATTAQAGDVKELWAKKCAICHGEDGKADTKAGKKKNIPSLADPAVIAEFDRARMIKSVTDGIPAEDGKGDKKKGFAGKLSDEEIAALVDYIYELVGAKPASDAGAPAADAAASAEAAPQDCAADCDCAKAAAAGDSDSKAAE